MTINMILFSVTIKKNKQEKEEYVMLKQVENELLDRRASKFNQMY